MDVEGVSLVIPGRNCARTLRECLASVVPLLDDAESRLAEIIFVDDGSTDDSAKIAEEFPIRCLRGTGGGPGAARNIGWRASSRPLIWFIDSDCVAEADTLGLLLNHIQDKRVGGVGGSYGNMRPDSLLACLIHEEIVERHRAMPAEVNFLGGFNVLYRRAVLEHVAGFDEHCFNGPGSPGAEDADMAYRASAAGFLLRFEHPSRVNHYHPTNLGRYLRAQRHHGYWRVHLHRRHRGKAIGDAYSSVVDNGQPLVAMLVLASLPLMAAARWRWIPVAAAALLGAMQLPMTLRLLARLRRARYAWFAALSFVRAFWRGAGMIQAIFG